MPRLRRTWPLSLLVLVVATACGGDRPLSELEVEATRLVQASVGEEVTCRDNGAVNTELHPEHPVGFTCRNADDESYFAVVSPDGELTSLSGPIRLRPAD